MHLGTLGLTTITFDTPLFVKRLVATGMPEPQAAAVTTLVREAQDGASGDGATKGDIAAIKVDLSHLASKADLAENKAEILRWLFAAGVGQTAVIVTLLKVLGH